MRNPYEPPLEESIPEDVEQPYSWTLIVVSFSTAIWLVAATMYAIARMLDEHLGRIALRPWPSLVQCGLFVLLTLVAIGGGTLAGSAAVIGWNMAQFNWQRRRHVDSERDGASD